MSNSSRAPSTQHFGNIVRSAQPLASISERRRGNAAVLPTEEPGEHELLAGLLAFAQGTASAPALLQHFPRFGHVITAEPSQLLEFGLTASDVTLLRLVREIACAAHHAFVEGGEASITRISVGAVRVASLPDQGVDLNFRGSMMQRPSQTIPADTVYNGALIEG